MGCLVKVTTQDGKITDIANYTCKKGKEYAKDELSNPTRMVTAVMPVDGRAEPLSVKTRKFIPKDKIFDCLEAIRAAKVALPVAIGDIVVPDVCGTGVDVIATKHLA
jgi:CxxC motif-containing protein